jgi:hypothetical protein
MHHIHTLYLHIALSVVAVIQAILVMVQSDLEY